ncbi:MAG: VOC family protein [Aureliella sp.]
MTVNQMNMGLVPYLSVHNAKDAISFYCKVFGVTPHVCLTLPDDRVMHCEIRIGATKLFLSDELLEHGGTPCPESLGNTTIAIHAYVDDCDLTTRKMQELGATVLVEPADMFWGKRFARVRDPFGHAWGLATLQREMTPQQIEEAARDLIQQERKEA